MRIFRMVLAAAACAACGDNLVAPATTTLAVRVTDGPGGPAVPAVLVLYDEAGDPLRIGTLDWDDYTQSLGFCELADGAVGTWEGIALAYGSAEIPVGDDGCEPAPAIPHGVYLARVMRGIEFEFFEAEVDLTAGRGQVALDAPLSRAFSPGEALAADLHVHSENSADSDVPQWVRVITEAAAGIQVIGASDHDHNSDYQDDIEALSMTEFVASIPGCEVTGGMGHFSVFPVIPDPSAPRGGARAKEDARALTARALFDEVRALPGRPLIQVNHPRLRWAAYFDDTGWDGVSWPPPFPADFDTLEVLSGFTAFNAPGDERIEEMVRDFYTLVQHGVLPAAVGNSDTHHLQGILAGLPRSYVWARDRRTDPFDVDGFVDALRARRAMATTGPWLDVRVMGGAGPGDTAAADGGAVQVEVQVRQASFVRATRVRIWVGGALRRTLAIPEGATAFDWAGEEEVGGADTWIGVDVAGDEPLPVALTGDRLAEFGNVVPFALINPILVDADRDGLIALPHARRVPPDTDAAPGAGAGDCGCDPPDSP